MTTGRGEGHAFAAGGPARHIPVLCEEVLAALAVKPGQTYLDATFGAGGYARAILAEEDTCLLALDRDPQAVQAGSELVAAASGRLHLVQARFGQLAEVAQRLHLAPFDGVVFDIGVSSMQLDQGWRGFSFRQDGPLDMRMEQEGRSAADIVNGADEATLADIFFYFGEERHARRLARRIVAERGNHLFASTVELADFLVRTMPPKKGDIHPATRVFQALRMAVNDELGELLRGLAAAEQVLRHGGRLAVVSFHSLEDRLVKQFLKERSGRGTAASRLLPGEVAALLPTFDMAVFAKQPIVPKLSEIAANPRARSAKLRAAQRTDAPARALEPALLALAELPHHRRKTRPGKRR
jgi:16S rRNA (cytosine1402-N4)-methyltransferase